jgi:hypothetical protein
VVATKIPLEEQVLVAGTKQILSNLLFLGMYGMFWIKVVFAQAIMLCILSLKKSFIAV